MERWRRPKTPRAEREKKKPRGFDNRNDNKSNTQAQDLSTDLGRQSEGRLGYLYGNADKSGERRTKTREELLQELYGDQEDGLVQRKLRTVLGRNPHL